MAQNHPIFLKRQRRDDVIVIYGQLWGTQSIASLGERRDSRWAVVKPSTVFVGTALLKCLSARANHVSLYFLLDMIVPELKKSTDHPPGLHHAEWCVLRGAPLQYSNTTTQHRSEAQVNALPYPNAYPNVELLPSPPPWCALKPHCSARSDCDCDEARCDIAHGRDLCRAGHLCPRQKRPIGRSKGYPARPRPKGPHALRVMTCSWPPTPAFPDPAEAKNATAAVIPLPPGGAYLRVAPSSSSASELLISWASGGLLSEWRVGDAKPTEPDPHPNPCCPPSRQEAPLLPPIPCLGTPRRAFDIEH